MQFYGYSCTKSIESHKRATRQHARSCSGLRRLFRKFVIMDLNGSQVYISLSTILSSNLGLSIHKLSDLRGTRNTCFQYSLTYARKSKVDIFCSVPLQNYLQVRCWSAVEEVEASKNSQECVLQHCAWFQDRFCLPVVFYARIVLLVC